MFHFRLKSSKEFDFCPDRKLSDLLNEPGLSLSDKLVIILTVPPYLFSKFIVTALATPFRPSYVDRFSYLTAKQREEIRAICEANLGSHEFFDYYEKLKGLTHFEKIKILKFARKITFIKYDEMSMCEQEYYLNNGIKEGDVIIEPNFFSTKECLINFCGANGFVYIGESKRCYFEALAFNNERLIFYIDAYDYVSIAQRTILAIKDTIAREKREILNYCSSCVYYHGKTYNGNQLVCGIHPYGLKDCPDFEEAKTTETDICE